MKALLTIIDSRKGIIEVATGSHKCKLLADQEFLRAITFHCAGHVKDIPVDWDGNTTIGNKGSRRYYALTSAGAAYVSDKSHLYG